MCSLRQAADTDILTFSLDQLVSKMICVHLFGFESGLLVGEPHEFILYILSHAGFPLNALWKTNGIA